MTDDQFIEDAKPILEMLAKNDGVEIMWFHPWTRDGVHHVTAFSLLEHTAWHHTFSCEESLMQS